MTNLNRRARRRGALLTAESLFVFPVLLLVLAGIVQFALMFQAKQRLNAACREGARIASRGGTEDDVEFAVRTVLGEGFARGSRLRVAWRAAAKTGNDPLVVVSVARPAALCAPDLLGLVGLGLKDRWVEGAAAMSCE